VIFVDTNAWFAAYVPNDSHHQAANTLLRSTQDRLLTTDFVLDELLTLLKARGEFQRALVLGERILGGSLARLEWVQPIDVQQAWQVFQAHKDKAWSFTDCVSNVVMARLGITKAFAFDEHFRQFGSVAVFP
jgi:predicted nucleic acid-binding protein